MKSASVPRPLAELIIRTMHEDEEFHHEGWTQRITAGWYIVRQSGHYKLLHGRSSLGTVEDVRLGPKFLLVALTSGLDLHFPIREPRRPEE